MKTWQLLKAAQAYNDETMPVGGKPNEFVRADIQHAFVAGYLAAKEEEVHETMTFREIKQLLNF